MQHCSRRLSSRWLYVAVRIGVVCGPKLLHKDTFPFGLPFHPGRLIPLFREKRRSAFTDALHACRRVSVWIVVFGEIVEARLFLDDSFLDCVKDFTPPVTLLELGG